MGRDSKVLVIKGSNVYHIFKRVKAGEYIKLITACGRRYYYPGKNFTVVLASKIFSRHLCTNCARAIKKNKKGWTGPPDPRPKSKFMVSCPYHYDSKKSCSIDIRGRCFVCFACHRKGSLSEYITAATKPKQACQHVFRTSERECMKCPQIFTGKLGAHDILLETVTAELRATQLRKPLSQGWKVTLAVYFKDGRVGEYNIKGNQLNELYTRAREHAHRIVNFGFRFDYKGGCCYVGPQELDKVEIEGMPPGEYTVTWRNL